MGVSVSWWRFVPSTRTIQRSTLFDALPEKTIHSPSGDQLPKNADVRLSETISIALISPPSTGTSRSVFTLFTHVGQDRLAIR